MQNTFYKTTSLCLTWVLFLANFCLADSYGYDAYINWDQLPKLKHGVQTHLASSYDRNGSNYDYSWYESPTGRITYATTATVKTIPGPGVLYRIWMPHLMTPKQFPIRLYFDGETTPRFSTDSKTLLNDLAYSYFDSFTLTNTCAGGQTSHEPIFFKDSLKIEMDNLELINWSYGNYYQYTYATLPPSTDIQSWTGTLTPEDQLKRDSVIDIFNAVGSPPQGSAPCAPSVNYENIPIPASAAQIIKLNGPATINKLTFKLSDPTNQALDNLLLKITYDQTPEPAIEASFADFFGAGHNRAPYQALPIGTDALAPDQGYYCYLPIPFVQGIEIAIQNNSPDTVTLERIHVSYTAGPLDNDTAYLYAKVTETAKQPGDIYHNILTTTGRGHYIGDILYVEQNNASLWILEGDDIITVDGDYTLYGTGLEDTYNGGAYYNWCTACHPQPDEPEGTYPQSATRPLSGILHVENPANYARADQYRWRLADCIPFTSSLEVNIENRYAKDGATFRSVAFWYQLPYPANDYARFQQLSEQWNHPQCTSCEGFDTDGNRKIDLTDLDALAASWLSPLL